ncbi:MAG: LptE family protein [Planctomycetota bacterium]
MKAISPITVGLIALLLCLPVLPACTASPRDGYSFASSFSDDVRTVSVPIFDNTTFTPGLGAMLSEAISKEIQRSTPWLVVSGERADTELTGTITDADLRRLSNTQGTGLVEEVALRLTADFDWTDLRTGSTRQARRGFSATSTFLPRQGINERIEVGQREAIEELAHDIVAELRSAW